MSSFNLLKLTFICSVHTIFLLPVPIVHRVNGAVSEEQFGTNLRWKFTNPRNILISFTVSGFLALVTFSMYSGDFLIPAPLITCPRKDTSYLNHSHLLTFTLVPYLASKSSTLETKFRCSSKVSDIINRSSIYMTMLWFNSGARICCITR